MGELSITGRDRALRLAIEIIRRHEAFHFRFDVYALHQELSTHLPLYNNYFEKVYRTVLCTTDCFEESLANRACVYASEWPDVGVTPFQIRDFVKRFCRLAPAGYRDFDRALSALRSGLGGQLFYGSSKAQLPEPQAAWVGNAGPFTKGKCPEYIIINRLAKESEVAPFTLKGGGYIWRVHKTDKDKWPSSPHAHDYQRGCKLSLDNGKVYDARTRGSIDRVDPEMLKELRLRARTYWPDLNPTWANVPAK